MPGTSLAGAETAATFLRELLNQQGRYRERWMHRVGKARDGEISQAAVARVIVDYVRSQSGMTPDYRKLRSRVHRALAGTSLTEDTLALFVGAFSMSESDARELWSRFAGADFNDVEVLHTLNPPPVEAAGFQASRFEIISSHETHYIDEDGLPHKHSAVQIVRALDEGLERFPISFDARKLTVASAVVDSADRPTSPVYRSTGTTYAFDILFPRPLTAGEEARIEYEVELEYGEVQPDFRRLVVRPMSDVSIAVYFNHKRVPRNVWWASWRDPSPDSRPMTKELVPVEPATLEPVPLNFAKVSKRLSFAASSSIVGFCWTWGDAAEASQLSAHAV